MTNNAAKAEAQSGTPGGEVRQSLGEHIWRLIAQGEAEKSAKEKAEAHRRLRDQFAIGALPALLAQMRSDDYDLVAQRAYAIADRMMTGRASALSIEQMAQACTALAPGGKGFRIHRFPDAGPWVAEIGTPPNQTPDGVSDDLYRASGVTPEEAVLKLHKLLQEIADG